MKQIKQHPVKFDFNDRSVPSETFSFEGNIYDIQTLPGKIIFPHWQEDFEFIFVCSGKLEFHINQKGYIISKGEGLFINAGQIHYAMSYQKYNCCFLSICVGKHMLYQNESDSIYQKYILPISENPSFSHIPLIPRIPWQKYILELLKKITAICETKNFGYELKIQHFVPEIFYYILQNISSLSPMAKKDQKDIQRIKKMMQYLDETYSQKHTLADIAASCSLSNSECSRIFQRILPYSPVDYLIRLRIWKSFPLILAHEKSMTVIAKEVGFSGSSYFSETFKKVLGYTPREFYKVWNSKQFPM